MRDWAANGSRPRRRGDRIAIFLLRCMSPLLTQSGHQHPSLAFNFTVTMARPSASGAAMRRREFITLLGATAAWPRAARAQQGERMWHIGVLLTAGEEPDYQARMAAFLNRLQQLGWTEGHNLRIDYRRSGSKSEDIRRDASELVALTPDIILTSGWTGLAQLLRRLRIVPILFVSVVVLVGFAFVSRLAVR